MLVCDLDTAIVRLRGLVEPGFVSAVRLPYGTLKL